MDSIRIKNIKISARHGVYEFEKEKDGIFEIDINLYLRGLQLLFRGAK